jgi:CubicO group peptidase (beta-lactamase class C family)
MLNKGKHGRQRIFARPTVEAMTTEQLTPEQRVAATPISGTSRSWGFGLSIVTKPDVVAAPPGRYGWNGGLGTTWWSDPKENMVAILLTHRMFESADPPNVCRDFWTSPFQAIND